MVSRKSLFVLLVGVSILVAPALLAQPGAGGERIYSPLTAETFHRIAREVSTDAISPASAGEAMAFLSAEYRVLAIFVVAVAVLLGVSNQMVGGDTNGLIAVSFVLGAVCSGLAGYFG